MPTMAKANDQAPNPTPRVAPSFPALFDDGLLLFTSGSLPRSLLGRHGSKGYLTCTPKRIREPREPSGRAARRSASPAEIRRGLFGGHRTSPSALPGPPSRGLDRRWPGRPRSRPGGSFAGVTLVVQKFGGTSVGDADRIRAVADHIARTRRTGTNVIVVVSAMGKTTDGLIRLAEDVSQVRPGRELDMLLTAGERISMSLLCMALAELGVPAASFTGSQAGIITDTTHTKARILEVKGDRLRESLAQGVVPVVAGFQGVSSKRDVTTLGRGGSDTTAVALAAALEADLCEIYTDVPGVFTADPRVVPTAHRIPRISFEEMLEIAATGGRVLALRSVEFARNHHVPLHVRSSFTWEPGTVVSEEDPSMEQPIVSAVTSDSTEAKVTITGVPDQPGIAASVFRGLADRAINVDVIVQNTSHHGMTDISFTVPRADLEGSLEVAEQLVPQLGAVSVIADDDVATVSLVGAGMRTHPGVTATMFETLAAAGINIEMISTSPIRISCLVRGGARGAGGPGAPRRFRAGGASAAGTRPPRQSAPPGSPAESSHRGAATKLSPCE